MSDFKFDFPTYLDSKKTIDDRSLNKRLLEVLRQKLVPSPEIIEIGSGTGNASLRLAHNKITPNASFYLLDSDFGMAKEGQRKLTEAGFKASALEGFIGKTKLHKKYDLVMAHAVLDLFNIEAIIDWVIALGKAEALYYFTINFDGLTLWEPLIDQDLDGRIIKAYHASMDERMIGGVNSGDSQSGRHLFSLLPKHGLSIVEAGSSDWAVWPKNKSYIDNDAYFLHCMLHFFETSLRGRPEISQSELDWWLSKRREQVKNAEAIFLAHQWDFLAKFNHP